MKTRSIKGLLWIGKRCIHILIKEILDHFPKLNGKPLMHVKGLISTQMNLLLSNKKVFRTPNWLISCKMAPIFKWLYSLPSLESATSFWVSTIFLIMLLPTTTRWFSASRLVSSLSLSLPLCSLLLSSTTRWKQLAHLSHKTEMTRRYWLSCQLIFQQAQPKLLK